MNTRKYRAGIETLMRGAGCKKPHIIALMGDEQRLYTVLKLLGFAWVPKTQDWRFRGK